MPPFSGAATLTIPAKEYLDAQNHIASTLTAFHQTSTTMLHASSRQLQLITDQMLMVRANTEAALKVAGIPFDSVMAFPNIHSLLLKKNEDIMTGAGMPPSDMAVFFPQQKKKQKKQRKPKDPNAPKRPQTAFFLYLEANRQKTRDNVGDGVSKGEISNILTREWNNLTEQEQAPYKQLYRQNYEKYQDDLRRYKESGGQVNDDDLIPTDPNLIDVSMDAAASSPDEDSSEDSSDSDSDEPVPPPKQKGKAKGKAAAQAGSPEKKGKKETLEETKKKRKAEEVPAGDKKKKKKDHAQHY